MLAKKPAEQHTNLVDQVAQSADEAIKSTQRVTDQALDKLAGSVQGLRQQASPMLNRATARASELAHRSIDAVHESSLQLRDKALRASDKTVTYIKDEPVKSVLMAAAAGAVLTAIVTAMLRSRNRA